MLISLTLGKIDPEQKNLKQVSLNHQAINDLVMFFFNSFDL